MAGRGTWPFHYGPEVDATRDPRGRIAFGLYALKKELVYNGFAIGLDPREPVFCASTTRQTVLFQQASDLADDGTIGALTGAKLFEKRIAALEHQFGVTSGWLRKLMLARSGNDPVAQGNQDEEGIALIELHFNPAISLEDAWDPAWALDYAVRRLVAASQFCDDDEGGIAAWSIGRIFAQQWVEAGKPASGGPQIGGVDAFARASSYVAKVSEC